MNKKPNRLINEKSPYLLQHAYNPVDWYPWGDEAFDKAHTENKLIFLSIGYSTCHWCHQMAHDAFSDEKTAEYLNTNYVSIKVDREERPDIDEIYMIACQLLSQDCGWPLNIVMPHDRKPVFATTYMPSIESLGRRSLLSVLEEIISVWQNNRNNFSEIGNLLSEQIELIQKETKKEEISKNSLEKAFTIFTRNFDQKHGGFGSAPKFPTAHNLSFLLKWYQKSQEKYALEMVEHTLHSMYRGGIFDHVGGGFHRYSTDKSWMVPHFEKMLYDQALISNVYIEAYQITGNELYADIAKRTLDFVLKELSSQDGSFFCGLDADTEGEEGKFYVWPKKEIDNLLESDAQLFCEFYGVTETGNFETRKNILHISNSIEKFCEKHNLSIAEVNDKFNLCLKKLYEARNKRTHPHIDDKVIASWNGLMIKSLSLAANVFNEEKYKTAAINAAEFMIEHLITPDGNIFRSYRGEKSNIPGFLEDYSFSIYGFLELYQTTSYDSYLETAKKLADKMIDEFYDETAGGFFSTSINSDTPLMRIKNVIDSAIPSGNSMAVLTLSMLKDITKNPDYTKYVMNTFDYLGYNVNQSPTNYSQLLVALIYSLS